MTTRETGDMLARPNWEWIKVDVLMPDHPKVEILSDRAFRELIKLWCYCGLRHSDGIVTPTRWQQVPAKVRAELIGPVPGEGLAEPMTMGGGVVMHDFVGDDGHQRTRAEIEADAAMRAGRARIAANARWGNGDRPP